MYLDGINTTSLSILNNEDNIEWSSKDPKIASVDINGNVTARKTGKTKIYAQTSNKSIATVNSSGVITAKKKGKATITANVNGKKYVCKVTVK